MDVIPEAYRSTAPRKPPGPPKDMTEAWDKYSPLAEAPERVRRSLEYFCESKRITMEWLALLETRFKIEKGGGITLAFPRYALFNGNRTVCAVKRRPLDPAQARNAEPGSRVGPPAAPQVVGNRESKTWIVVEGETDGARMLGLTDGKAAIVILGGTGGARYAAWDKYPADATVYIALDSDSRGPEDGPEVLRGEEAAAMLLERVPNAIRLRPPEGVKDWCEWDGDAKALAALMKGAASQNGAPADEEDTRQEARADAPDDAPEPYVKPIWKGPPPELARNPDILAELRRDLALLGVGGETSLTQLCYLALTSRVLPWEPTSRPMSMIAKGTSSSGKTYTVSNVIRFLPPGAVIRLTSASNLYLLYDKRSLSHAFIFVPEWTTIAEKEEFVSMLRTLVSDGRIEHGTVEGLGRKGTRLLTKEGPTGLLMTTTSAMTDPELETRCFTLRTDDTPEQTRTIFRTLSKNHREGNPGIDLDRWIEFQLWIEAQENRVLVPFSDALSELMPNSAVRLRRDFVTILCLTQAHAILYQAQRKRDRSGRIVATLDDYEAVRALTDVLVAEEVGHGVTPAMKDTVLAVHEIVADSENDYATVKEIARALEIGDQATYDRVSRAQVAGLLENVSEGRKKKLRVAGELPEGTTFLPSVEAIRAFAARTPLGGLGVSEESSQTRMDKGSTSSDVHSETDRRSGNSTNLRNASEETSEIANPHGDRDPSVTSEAPTAPRDMGTDGTQENLDQEPGWLARSLEEDQDEGEDPYERA